MSEEGRIQYSSLKIALITIQLLCTALFSGILFGWAPFQLIMINEGLYACDSESTGGLVEDENDEYNSNQNSNDEKEECVSQQTNLNLLFTIATSTFLISSLFIGIFVDHYGPTRTVILNGVVVSFSLILIAIAPVKDEGLFLLIAFLLGLGGAITLTGAFPIAFVVHSSHMPILMSAINCFFDASAVIFLFCYLIYIHLEISRLILFLIFGFIAVILYTLLTILWYQIEPEFIQKKRITSELNIQSTLKSVNELTSSIPSQQPQQSPFTNIQTNTSIPSITTIHSQNWFKNFPTRLFYFLSMYGAIQIFRFNYYFGSVLDLLEDLGDDSYNYLFTQIFIALLPLGFLCLPIIDWIFQKYGFIGAFHVLNCLSISYNIIVLIPILSIQVLTFIFFVTGRALLFSLIGTYVAHMFGPLNSGKMYGSFSWVAVLANIFQYPLFILVTKTSPGYEGLTYLNIFTLCLCVPLVWLCYHDLQIILKSFTGSDVIVVKSYESLEPDGDEIIIGIEALERGNSEGMTMGTYNILHENQKDEEEEGDVGDGIHREAKNLDGLQMIPQEEEEEEEEGEEQEIE